ncbi:MAG: hypothetical protein IKO72_01385 [Kiritimatiellae bacterium]|nr:hypothetical protein [Kiritimatiellia bacterium]
MTRWEDVSTIPVARLLCLLAAACALLASAAVPVVTFDSAPVRVEEMTVSAIPFNRYWPGHQRPRDQTKKAYFAAFDTDRGGLLQVDGEKRVIDGPGKHTFMVDGGRTELHVFADPPWRHEKTPGELYFGPGEHFPGLILPEDGQTVVIDRGAVVHGTVFIYRKRGVRIVGRGILDLSDLARADKSSKVYAYVESLGLPPNELGDNEKDAGMSCTAIVAYGARDLRIEGITIRDSPRWTIMVRNDSRGVTIDNVKILGSWRYNSDGIDICSSSEINVRNCFVRTYDDAFVVRAPFLTGERTDCRDILVEDSVTWNDWGCTMGVAQQRLPSAISGVTFRRIRAERVSSALSTVHVSMGSTNSVIRDVLFEDIEAYNVPGRLEQALQKSDDDRFIPKVPKTICLATVGSRRIGRWTNNQTIVNDVPDDWYRFDFDNIVFRRFRVHGSHSEPICHLATRMPRHTVRNLVLEDMPPNMRTTEKGDIIRIPVAPPDRNSFSLPGGRKVAFRIDLGKSCFPTPVRTVLAREMRDFSASTDASGRVSLVWKGHPLCGDGFKVFGECDPGKGRFSIRTEGNSSGYEVQRVVFPEPVPACGGARMEAKCSR